MHGVPLKGDTILGTRHNPEWGTTASCLMWENVASRHLETTGPRKKIFICPERAEREDFGNVNGLKIGPGSAKRLKAKETREKVTLEQEMLPSAIRRPLVLEKRSLYVLKEQNERISATLMV